MMCVFVKLIENINGVFVDVAPETFVSIREKELFNVFVLPPVGILEEFFCGRKVLISIESRDVGGLKEDIDKATVGFFYMRGAKMSIDFKDIVFHA